MKTLDHSMWADDVTLKAMADLEAQLKAAQEEHINQMSSVQLRLAEMKDQLASAEQRTAEACAEMIADLYGDEELGAVMITAGDWRKFVKGE